MTDDQINWAITEAIGADPHWKCAKDYCNDLNAMHEAEKVLNKEQIADYFYFVWPNDCEWRWAILATARQRAEAFLRTLGKWSATNKESLTVEATAEDSSVDHFRGVTKEIEEVQK